MLLSLQLLWDSQLLLNCTVCVSSSFGSKTLIPWQIKPVNPPNFSLFDSLESSVKTFVGKAKDKLDLVDSDLG